MNSHNSAIKARTKLLALASFWVLCQQTIAEDSVHIHSPPATIVPTQTEQAMPAMEHSSMDHSMMGHGTSQHESGSVPADGRDPHAYSNGYRLDSGPYALAGPRQLHMADEHSFSALRIDRLERVYGRDDNATAYDAQAWFGGTYDRLLLKVEGERSRDTLQEARTELLWSHALAPFWDRQLGLRHDSGTGADREWLAVGLQGLAPYWFEVDATAYLGSSGRSALRLSSEYELLLTQRAILQPHIELNLYGKEDQARELGSGLAEGSIGMRLRYEFSRQIAPYLGVEWTGKFGETADLARADGGRTADWHLVGGMRFWF